MFEQAKESFLLLFGSDSFYKVIPPWHGSVVERGDAITRLLVYVCVLMFFFRGRDPFYLYTATGVLLTAMIIHALTDRNADKEGMYKHDYKQLHFPGAESMLPYQRFMEKLTRRNGEQKARRPIQPTIDDLKHQTRPIQFPNMQRGYNRLYEQKPVDYNKLVYNP